MKDYYATLGVTPQAEDIVIKAAYRALAQRYHPDRFAGSANEANRKMAEINEAYGVLSDPVKRKAYDAEYQQAGGNEGDFEAGDAAADEGVKQIDRDWETALEYYPDLVTLEAVLAKTSKSLAFTFRLYMISEKTFKNRKQVAEALHNAFLTNYFGEQRAILDFAKTLIGIGRKDAAKALNEAVRVLGDDLDPVLVINRIKGRFGLFPEYQQPSRSKTECQADTPHERPRSKECPPNMIDAGSAESRAERMAKMAARLDSTVSDLRNAIDELGGSFQSKGDGCVIHVLGESCSVPERAAALQWFRESFYPRLFFSGNPGGSQ